MPRDENGPAGWGAPPSAVKRDSEGRPARARDPPLPGSLGRGPESRRGRLGGWAAAYLAGKSVINSSGTSSWRGTGRSGCLGQEMKSHSTAVSTQSSMSKYCTASARSPASACWAREASQTGQGTYCSMSGVPSLSVAVKAKWGRSGGRLTPGNPRLGGPLLSQEGLSAEPWAPRHGCPVTATLRFLLRA